MENLPDQLTRFQKLEFIHSTQNDSNHRLGSTIKITAIH